MKKKAKIYIPTKTAMQSGRGKLKDWILEFETREPKTNALMGWETSDDTLEEVKLKFSFPTTEYGFNLPQDLLLLKLLLVDNLLLNYRPSCKTQTSRRQRQMCIRDSLTALDFYLVYIIKLFS